jgi:hypothetical protein
MSRERQMLPEHLAWNGEHASEAALVALADAQVDIVPDSVARHLETCPECNDLLAELATLSVSAEAAILSAPRVESVPAASAQVLRLPIPWRALVIAAAVAALGAAPALAEAPGRMSSLTTSVVRIAPALVKALAQLFRAQNSSVGLTFASAIFLLMVGVALTRALPQPRRVDSRGASR